MSNVHLTKTQKDELIDKVKIDNVSTSINLITQDSALIGIQSGEINYTIASTNYIDTKANELFTEIDSLKKSVSNNKSLLARAITDKGVATNPSDSFEKFQQGIYYIQTSEDPEIDLSYGFYDNRVGNGSGLISLLIKKDYYKSAYQIYWGDINNEVLKDYDAICELDVSLNNYASYKTNPLFCIPIEAKTLLCHKDGMIVGKIKLPDYKLISSPKNYSFGLLSDIHLNPAVTDTSDSIADFTKALDYFKNISKCEMILINGDILTYGTLEEMQKFRELANGQTLPIYCCRGNHDTYKESDLANFTKYIEPNGLYYEKFLNNDVYIFFGMISEDVATPYDTAALDWLEYHLETHKNERVFLFQHVFIEPVGNVTGLYAFSDGLVNSNGTASRRYRDLMSKYRNVIFFSGHSHFEFSLQRLSETANCSERTENMCHRIHVPSGCKVRTCDFSVPPKVFYKDDSGEGYTVDVYKDFIVLKGFNVVNKRLVTSAQYILYTTPIAINSVEYTPSLEYDYKTDFTTYELGSLSSSGADRTSSSSWRSSWIELNDNPAKSFRFPRGITYLRICIYDKLKQFIMSVPNSYEDGASTPTGTVINIPQFENAVYIKFKAQGNMDSIEFNGEKSNQAIALNPLPYRPVTVKLPNNITYQVQQSEQEPNDKYEKAKFKALNFIKRQMNVSNFYSPVTVNITEMFAGANLIHGVIDGLNNPAVIQNKYISLDQVYEIDYVGKISGKWHNNLKNPQYYRIDIHLKSDVVYFIESCDLKEDNTWTSEREAQKGYKHIELVNKETGMQVEYAYPIVDNYYVKVYLLDDVEYEMETCKIYLKDGKYQFFSNTLYEEKMWLAKVFDLDGNVVGMSSQYSNIKYGQLPSSYLVPPDDPNFDKYGDATLGKNGYLLNSRSFIYDVGLSLLVFTKEHDFEMCKKLMDRMQYEQKESGAFNFSYDNYIGQLFEDYIRTGSVGWLVWGMCYYVLESGDFTYNEMILKAGEWILSQQVLDILDNRYGLLKGGIGEYDTNYIYSPTIIEWCSTEHNCSALQAIKGIYKLTQDEKYKTSADLIINALATKLYDSTNNRFFQGCTVDSVDAAWSIDCLSWAGKTILSAGYTEEAKKCKDTILLHFKIDNVNIVQNASKEHYNKTYSLQSGVMVSGFKPYYVGYDNPPSILWTEGTLGVIALLKQLNEELTANIYIDEIIKMQDCNNSTGGLVYSNEAYTLIPYEFPVWESVASSAWLYLVLTDCTILF